MIITYKEIAIMSVAEFKCKKCGKHRTYRKKIWRTQNPFNKNEKGEIKSIQDIRTENERERKEWVEGRIKNGICNKCHEVQS